MKITNIQINTIKQCRFYLPANQKKYQNVQLFKLAITFYKIIIHDRWDSWNNICKYLHFLITKEYAEKQLVPTDHHQS